MSGGFYVPCAPFLYLVPDSAAPPGMELQQRSPGPFHYLINEQAKSLVALQELQNEVGALLEFRDLVMDTFPHLRNKMAPTVTSTTISSPPSNIPIPLASSLNSGRREWEPGIRVRRKLPHKDQEMSSLPRRKPLSSQPKSGDTSSAGSSAVQDSGFSTETSSSKEQCISNVQRVISPKETVQSQSGSGISSGLDEAEDELWNLLDVIHRKGTKLREEVECLQEKLNSEEKEKEKGTESDFERLCKTSLDGGEGLAYMGDIMDIKDGRPRLQDFKTGGSMRCVMEGAELTNNLETNIKEKFRNSKLLMNLGSEMGVDSDDEIRELKFERDYLLDKVSEMEAETLATRAKASQLKTELGSLSAAKKDLEEQLKTAVTQKCELNTRIHDLHIQFVGKPTENKKIVLVPTSKKPLPNQQTSFIRPPSVSLKGSSCFTPVTRTIDNNIPKPSVKSVPFLNIENSNVTKVKEGAFQLDLDSESHPSGSDNNGTRILNVRLGTLDGIVSNPSRLPKGVVPCPKKMAAILNEFSAVELQRHLLATTVENQDLQSRLDQSVASHLGLEQQYEKIKDENDDLRFQLEEKHIDLEGTKAQVRVLERRILQQKPPPSSPEETHLHSTTESAHDSTPHDITNKSIDTSYSGDSAISPRKRPSRIPLGTKSYTAPKPPVGKSVNKEIPKSKDSLALTSLGKTRNSSSLSQKNSLNGRLKDSLPGKKESLKKCDSLNNSKMSSYTSSVGKNSLTKKDLSYSSTNGRKSLQRLSTRRGGNVTRSNTTLIDDGDTPNSKTLANKVSKHSDEPLSDSYTSPSRNTAYKSTFDTTPPWNNSSSSEYFDSINNSATVFNATSQLHSCSDSRDEYFNSSTQHEGMAEFDSLEMEIPARNGKLILSRNIWVTAESIIDDAVLKK